MKCQIRQIRTTAQIKESVKIIRESFTADALKFGVSEEENPSFSAFMTHDRLNTLYKDGIKLFGLYYDQQIGFMAIEKADESTYYLEKLCVLPEYRHKGLGIALIDFAFAHVSKLAGKRISIAIIDEHTKLKTWYQKYGFVETHKKKFAHHSFTACFLEKYV